MSTLVKRNGLRVLMVILILTLVMTPFVSVVNGATGSQDQVGSYVDVDSAGNTKDGSTTTNPVIKVDSKSKTYVEHSKTVQATDTEDIFKIDLNVKTTEIREDVTELVPKALDVVIMMDVSGSMNGSMGGTSTRWTVARDSMISFINGFLGSPDVVSGSQVAIGTFSGRSETPPVPYNDHNISLCEWTSDPTAAVGSISGLNSATAAQLPDQGGLTNMEAGFVGAEELFAQVSGSGNDKVLIYVGDGDAGNHYDDSGHTQSGSNDSESTDRIEGLKSTYKGLKVFTLGIGPNVTTNPVLNYKLGQPEGVDKFFSAVDASDIGKAFDEIKESITHTVKLWTVVDPMSKWVQFMGFDKLNGGNTSVDGTATFADNKINWNLANNVKKEGDTYTYTLSYYVKLDKTVPGFTPGVYYPTNGETTLQYAFDKEQVGGEMALSNFKIPTVKGIAPQVAGEQAKEEKTPEDKEQVVLGEEAKTSDAMKAFPYLVATLIVSIVALVVVRKKMTAK